MVESVAPFCPITRGQDPPSQIRHGVLLNGGTVPIPSIPAAVDLPSLIRTTNVIRDILRSLTINNISDSANTNQPRPGNTKIQGNTYYSQYPTWEQTADTAFSIGFVYHHLPNKTLDTEQRAYIRRINRVTFQNINQQDPEFIWSYVRPLDG